MTPEDILRGIYERAETAFRYVRYPRHIPLGSVLPMSADAPATAPECAYLCRAY